MDANVRRLATHPPTTPEPMYSKEPTFLAIAATLVSIALLSFSLRVYTRTSLLRFFGIDDCLMLISVLCALGALAGFILLLQTGPGEQPDGTSVGYPARRYFFIVSLLGIAGIGFAKLSVVFFLFRSTQRRTYRRLLYLSIIILIILTGFWFLTVLFGCTSSGAVWNLQERVRTRCMSRDTYHKLAFFNGSGDVVTGFALACLSLTIAYKPQLGFRTKLSLVIVLTLGLLSCCAAVVRISMIHKMLWEDRAAHDPWWCVWSIIEMSTGIAAACLPTLKPLLSSISAFFADLKPYQKHRDEPKREWVHESRPPSPYAASYSTPTFLSLPRPKPARFHDHASDLDFDLFDSPTHRSRAHSRNPSNLTMLSNFTTLTNVHTEYEGVRPRACSKGLVELGEDMRGFNSGYAVSVTSGSGETGEGSEDGKCDRKLEKEDEGQCGGGTTSSGAAVGGIKRTTEVIVR